MRAKRLLSITITDEARLTRRARWTGSPWKLWALSLLSAIILMVAGGALVGLTPLRRLMPGYMGKEERTASETAWLRIDSLRQVLDQQRAYIDNFTKVIRGESTESELPVKEQPFDSVSALTSPLDVDSLLMRSEAEERFVRRVERRDRFNYSVLAPLAAEGIVFHFPATEGIYTSHPADSMSLRLLLAREATVRSVAEGTVVGVTRSVRERGYIVWIQHENGFLSRYSRLGTPLVDQGTHVEGGEAIALPSRNTGTASEAVDIQLWHNSERIPARRFLPER